MARNIHHDMETLKTIETVEIIITNRRSLLGSVRPLFKPQAKHLQQH